MLKQPAFPDAYDTTKATVTRRERFSTVMYSVVPSGRLLALSDRMADEPRQDGGAVRSFAIIELGDGRVADVITILNFGHLQQRDGLTDVIFADVNAYLADTWIFLRADTLIDATIIDAPSWANDKTKARNPEMPSTKKHSDWCFGLRAHIGVDRIKLCLSEIHQTTPTADLKRRGSPPACHLPPEKAIKPPFQRGLMC